IKPARVSQHGGHQINLDGLTGDLDDLFTEVDLDLLARWGLEPDSGQRPGPFLLTQGRHGPLQGPQVDMDPSGGQFLLNDDGVSLGNSTEELVDFTERGAVEAPRRKTFLKADRGSSEITADGVAGDPQLSSNPFAPETLAGKLADPIHDIRFEHPGVLLRRSQVDICYIRLARLRVKQVNQIGVDVVHIPSLTSVQEGVSLSVVKGVSFGVAPHPGVPKSASDCCFLFGCSLHLPVTGSAITLRVSRLQSSFRAYFTLILRPASWLALLSRTFTFELALAGSPRTNVEYDYVGKQSIPTTGLSPASPTALWAAVQDQLLAGKDEKIAVACLERVARGRADGSGDVKLGRLGIEQPVPAHPEILPAEWLARGRKHDHVDVAIVVEVIVDDGRDRQIRQRQPMGWGQVRERAVEVVVEHPTPRRRLRLIRRHRTGLDPHREQVKVAIAVQIGQPRAGGQVLSAGFGLSGRLGELALAVAQQKQVLPGPAQPEIEVAIVVDVAQAGNNRLVGKPRPGLEVALAIVEEHHGLAKSADPRQHHVLVAV